jgi:hypothetical protein
MSWTTIGDVSDEQVDAVATGSNVQVTIGSLPNEVRLMLPVPARSGCTPRWARHLRRTGAPPMPELGKPMPKQRKKPTGGAAA